VILQLTDAKSDRLLGPAGDFGVRVQAGRNDELGSLAHSFNALGDFGVRVQAGRNDELGSLAHSFNALGDIVSLRDKELRELAFVDLLTGLANRVGFLYFIAEHLHPESEMSALLILNINNFHYINEHLGYQEGDMVLRCIAGRLKGFKRPVVKVARLGGNTFSLMLERINEEDLTNVLAQVDTYFTEPIFIDRQRLDMSATSGVAIYPAHGLNAEVLLRNAEVALCNAT